MNIPVPERQSSALESTAARVSLRAGFITSALEEPTSIRCGKSYRGSRLYAFLHWI